MELTDPRDVQQCDHFKNGIFKHILQIDIIGISCEFSLM